MEVTQDFYPEIQQHQPSIMYSGMGATASNATSHINNSTSAPINQPNQDTDQVNTQLKRSNSEIDNRYSKRTSNSEMLNSVSSQSNSINTQYSIPTSNRFSCLQDIHNQETVQDIQIPPIFMKPTENQALLVKEITMNITSNFETQFKNNKIKIQLKTINDFRNTVKYLLSKNRNFHTYSDPTNKKYSIIYKNTHTSFSEEQIFEELKSQFKSLKKITRLYKDNAPIPVISAEFSGEEDIDIVIQHDKICNTIVKPEKRRKTRGPLQCQRCLDFGHTKNNCNHKLACAFCAGEHYSAACTKRDQPVTCKNCNGKHRGDLRTEECPYYKRLTDLKQQPNQNRTNNNPKSKNITHKNSTDFPALPSTYSLPNFTQVNSNHNTTDKSSHFQNTHTNNDNQFNDNNFIHNLTQSITQNLIKLINTIIPTIINSLQSAIISVIYNSNASTTK